MKKHNIITTVLFLPLLMLCTSCWNSVLYEIRKDVAPESATVSGNIPQITRFTLNDEEYIFVSANGGLRYKKADNQEHGSWATMTVPFELLHFDYDTTSMVGRQIAGVFANTDTLYLIAVPYSTSGSEGTTNPLTLELWASKTPDVTASWTQLNKDSAINYFPYVYDSVNEVYKARFNAFQTNTPKKEHRHAYLCSYIPNESGDSGEYKYYELSGLTLQEITISNPEDAEAGSRVYGATWFNGAVRFFTSQVVITDETANTDPTYIYYSVGGDLYYSSADKSEKACSVATNTVISAITVTKDSIILGLGNLLSTSDDNGGIARVLRDDTGIPGNTTVSFDSNADFQINKYAVLSLINTTPENTESESILYASITFSDYDGLYDNIGLWSYYPSRGNWNRE